MIARCPYCKSILVCWNWIHAFGGDREAYEKANPYISPTELYDWGHECWSCGDCFETRNKIKNGIPYKILKLLYKIKRKLPI